MSTSPSTWVKDIHESDFEREVIERSHTLPVVVDFWAPWCGPCRLLGPILERLTEERGGAVVLVKLNIDEAQDVAARAAIEAIPAVKAFRKGQVVLEFVGVLPENQLRDFFDRIVPSEADRLAEQAAAVEASNAAEAETLYRRALAAQPGQEAASVGLARLLLAHGQDDEAARLLTPFGPGSELGPEVERLNAVLDLRQLGREYGDEASAQRRLEADPDNAVRRYELGCVLAAAGKYPEALERLLAAAERDRKLATAKVREAMVKVFYAVGVRSPLADAYRDKLTQMLY